MLSYERHVVMTKKDWYDYPRIGKCENCGRRGRRTAHHVVRQQDLSLELRDDVNNRMLLGWYCCHYRHSNYGVEDTRISYTKVPEAAKTFAHEALGEGPAMNFFRRYYRDAP